MCMLFLYANDDCEKDGYRLIIASNRDEFWDRPTKPAAFWEHNDECISGLDQKPGREGGTWLGVSKSGKIGVLLNIIDYLDASKKGRGHFIGNYLTSDLDGNEYIRNAVVPKAEESNKFNLILIQIGRKTTDISYFNNLEERHIDKVDHGIHIFENSTPSSPWNKSVTSKPRFSKIIDDFGHKSTEDKLVAELFHLLSDRTRHEIDDQLASQASKANMSETFTMDISANFVFSPSERCGTRTHTLVLVDKDGHCQYIEKTMNMPVNPDNVEWCTNSYKFEMDLSF